MTTTFFLSIPVTDIPRTRAFFAALGWPIDEALSDETAACAQIDERVSVMAIERERLQTFSAKPLSDPKTTVAFQIAFGVDSREAVDATIAAATSAGGIEVNEAQDYGTMYARDFEDPDGNLFSAMWMDPEA